MYTVAKRVQMRKGGNIMREEKYEKEAKAVYEQIQNYMCETPAWTFIAAAMQAAYEAGVKKGEER
jgi:hypothetical protein